MTATSTIFGEVRSRIRNMYKAATGAPVRSGLSNGFDAASQSARLANWQTTGAGINSLINGGGDTLRQRSRDTIRKNPLADNAISSYVSNCVGTGIKPESLHPDLVIRKLINTTFDRWTSEADVTGNTNFYGLQALICRSTFEAGEVFARSRYRRLSDGLTVPLQIQVLESEHLPYFKNERLANGNVISSGIEYNPIGQRVAYHLYREHPGELQQYMDGWQLSRVPASSVAHTFQVIRPGQNRGLPFLTQSLLKLHDLDRYDDAELTRKGLAASHVAVIYDEDDTSILPEEDEGEDGTPISVLEPGTTTRLRGNQRIVFSEPSDVGGMYTQFMKMQLRIIAAGIGITYEQLTGDLEGVNYSSIRAGLLEFRRRCEQFQSFVLAHQFCRPVWKDFIEAGVLAGIFNAAEYASFPERYLAVNWVAPKWPWVDPLKDLQAEELAVRCGFKARATTVQETGENVEEVDEKIAADNDRADKLGLRFDSDGRNPKNGGASAQESTNSSGASPGAGANTSKEVL